MINLSACLAEMGHRVLVIDLDPQANATSGLGLPIEPGRSLYNALLDDAAAGDLILPTPIEHLDIIPSELDLAGSEIDVARQDQYLHCFQRALAPVIETGRYEFVLVDCPPSLGILTMNALAAADSMVVPMQCEYYALEGLSVIADLVRRLQEAGANPHIRIEGILMTMFDSRTNLSGEVVKEVREHFGRSVYSAVIPRNVRLSEAPSYGQPITSYAPHCPGANAYRAFAAEFRNRALNPVDGPEPESFQAD